MSHSDRINPGKTFRPNAKNNNNLRTLPSRIFAGLAKLGSLQLHGNDLQTLPDGIFDDLADLGTLNLERNPGTASFRPTADAGTDRTAVSGETVRFDGSASRGGPWGTNITYTWAVADGLGNPVTDLTMTGGDTSTPSFVMPETAPGGELVFTLTVQGKGHRQRDEYKSTASAIVEIRVKAAPVVTSVALVSVPLNGRTYSNGERIEVAITFAERATAVISGGTPRIGLTVGTVAKTAGYIRGSGGRNLVFAYEVQASDTDTDGVSVPANSLAPNGGRIVNPDGVMFRLTHDGLSDNIGHRVDGSGRPLMGGVCGRTSQVRVALLSAVWANDVPVPDCSHVSTAHLQALTGTLNVRRSGIIDLMPGDFANLSNLTELYLDNNDLRTLPDGVFEGLANLEILYLHNNDLRTLPDGIFGGLANLRTLYLDTNDLRTLPDGIFGGLANLGILYLHSNPGAASFRPTADAGTDQKAVSGTTVTLDGGASRGGPWGTNITYAWSVVDGLGNPVSNLTLTGGDTSTPSFIVPETILGDGLVVTLTVQGKGGILYKSTDSVRVAMDVLPLVWVNAVDATVTEGTNAQFRFSRLRDSTSRLEVRVRISGHRKVMSSAVRELANSLESANFPVVTFEAGTTEATLDLATEADSVNEGNGKVSVTIMGPSGAYEIGGNGSATVLVQDDDIPEVTLRWISPAMTLENNVWVGSMVEGQDIEYAVDCTGGTLATETRSNRFPVRRQELLNHPVADYNVDFDNRLRCPDQPSRSQIFGTAVRRYVGPSNGRIVIDLFPQVLSLRDIPGGSSDYDAPCDLDSDVVPADIRYCPKFTLGAVTSALIETSNRNPTIVVEALEDEVPEGQSARFRVRRIWASDVLDLYSTAFNFEVRAAGPFAESVPNGLRTFGVGDSELIIEIPTVNDGMPGADGSVTFTLVGGISEAQATNVGGHYEVYNHLPGITPRGKNSRVVSVRILNDANALPTSDDRTVTVDEDMVYAFGSADFAFKDLNRGDALASVRITVLPEAGKGTLALDGNAVTAAQVIAASELGTLTFAPPANANGEGYASFMFTVSDGLSESAAPYTMTVEVTAVNDAATGAPTISGTARVGQELTAEASGIADVDGLPAPATFAWQWLQVDGGSDTEIGGATARTYRVESADVGKKFRVRVEFTDLDGTAEARTSAAYPASESVEPNAAPTGANRTVTVEEDGSYTFAVPAFGFADTDGDALASVKITALPAAGTLALDGNAVAADQVIAASDLGKLTYTPPADANDPGYASFAFKVSDGTSESALPYVMTIDVTAVNDPATGLPTISGTARVGQTLTADASGIADDADGLPALSTFSYQWLRVDGGRDAEIQGAESKTYRLVAADAGAKFRVRVSFTDLDGHEEVLTSAEYPAGSPVVQNAAPTGAGGTVTVAEDTAHTFQASEFGFADTDGDAFASVNITVLPDAGKGTLALDGNAVAAAQVIAASELGTLTFAPPANANGPGYASFTFKVSDGTSESAAPYVMTIDVTAVNDPATGAPTISGTARVGQTLTADASGIADDSDGLPAPSTFNYQWLRVDGGRDAEIQGADSKTYRLVAADAGAKFKVTVSFTDLDGHEEVLTSAEYPAGSPVVQNAAPTGAGGTVTVAEDTAHTFQASEFGFADTDGDAFARVKITVLPDAGKGTLALGGNAVTADQVIAASEFGTLTYTPPADANDPGYAQWHSLNEFLPFT